MERRTWVLLSVALAFAVVIAAVVVGFQVQIGPVVTVCHTDEEITADDRKAADEAATAFLRTVLGPTPQQAFATMSPEGRKGLALAQFEAVSKQLQADQSAGSLSVSHTYEIEGVPGSGPAARAPCSEPTPSGGTAFVRTGGAGAKQAHILVVEPLVNAKRTFDMWMTFEGGAWRVYGFYGGLSEIAGRDGDTLWSLAKAQRARGHDFNAALLYFVAGQTMSRGPYFQGPSIQSFQKDVGSFPGATELKGPPPFHWTLQGQAFSVASVEYNGVNDGKIVLVITQTPEAWKGERDADQRNRRLIEAFMAVHPEWTEAFDAIAARSPTDRPGASFGSVYEKGIGYIPQKFTN